MNIIEQLSESERAYFIACTDIFHDSPYSVIGRPSESKQLQNTVTLNLERTITIADFPSLPQDGTWSANIISLPFLTSQTLASVNDTGRELQLPAGYTTQEWGGVMAFGSVVGGSTILPATPYVSLNANSFFYPEYTGSPADHITRPFYEVLSIGTEIINATPPLYKSGNVIRYRVPTQGRKASLVALPSASPDYRWPTTEYYCYPMPPTSEAFATQYPDSVIDEAAAGSYQMHARQDQVSDFYEAGTGRVSFTRPSPPPPGGYNSWSSYQPYTTDLIPDPPIIRGDFDMIGSYFTGLSPQTILKIRYRSIVSLIPSSFDASLTSLAKQTPDPNPALDELISRTQNLFTPGIEASMNSSGDWWRVVLRGVAKIAKPTGKALGGEKGEMIGELAGGALKGVSKLGEKKKKKGTKVQVPEAKPKAAKPKTK